MKIELDFRQLRVMASRMGARQSDWTLRNTPLNDLNELRRELAEGIEIPLEEVDNTGGLLTHKGEQIVLYIKSTRIDRDTLLNDKWKANRFHVAECRTLEHMRKVGRLERYVVTTRKNGSFHVEATDRETGAVEELEAELGVCINCMQEINWHGSVSMSHDERRKLWDDFSLEDFFAEYSTFFHNKPTYTDKTAPIGEYVKNWSDISQHIRRERNWTCENKDCLVNLKDRRGLLHCHHVSGVVSDNRKENIKVLCLLCHSKEPAHNHLKPSNKNRREIEQLRVAQRLNRQ